MTSWHSPVHVLIENVSNDNAGKIVCLPSPVHCSVPRARDPDVPVNIEQVGASLSHTHCKPSRKCYALDVLTGYNNIVITIDVMAKTRTWKKWLHQILL